MSLLLWRDDITPKNILKHTIIKFITYTSHYAHALPEQIQLTKLTDFHYLNDKNDHDSKSHHTQSIGKKYVHQLLFGQILEI